MARISHGDGEQIALEHLHAERTAACSGLLNEAVVRWLGKPYAYIETSGGEFARHPVPTGIATPGGWLVPSGLHVGTGTVVRGAQLLLSEETKVQSAGGKDQ